MKKSLSMKKHQSSARDISKYFNYVIDIYDVQFSDFYQKAIS